MTTGRRALPPEEAPGPVTPARRMADRPPATPPTSGVPRRGAPVETGERDTLRAWMGLGVLALAMAVAVALLYLMVGPRDSLTATPLPSAPAVQSPQPSASPTAASGATTTDPSSAPTASDTPSASPSPEIIDLGDAVLTVPSGWEVYADELVQDGRRLVRLRDPATDTRVQAVTLTSVDGDLTQACRDLVTDQQRAFTGVAESVVVDVPLTGAALGVSCAFTGTRTEDDVDAKVEFTLLRRDADSQTLIFRDTVPGAVADESPALAQLAAMECAAAETFGAVIGGC